MALQDVRRKASRGRAFSPALASGLILLLLLGPGLPPGASAADAPNQCVACHLDAAKLKQLTPPDPPASEAGEG